ncbi:MAG: hypothetical protein KDK72_10585 [Chlamydiia bacterium]|nr:hypothetical protein [Chlamydiia bacterium]
MGSTLSVANSCQLNYSCSLSLIEQLPSEVLGTIVAEIPNVTGSPKIINEAEIPVAMRYLLRLGSTSKNMYQHVHDCYVIKLFFESFAKKHHTIPENIAIKINTLVGRRFIWDSIKANHYDKLFDRIKNIYSSTYETLQKAKEADPENEGFINDNPSPSEPIGYYQTKSGIFLYFSIDNLFLATPFGQVTMPEIKWGDPTQLSAIEQLIKRLNATYVRSTCHGSSQKNHRFFELDSSSEDSGKIKNRDASAFKDMTEKEQKDKKGSNKLFFCKLCDNVDDVYAHYSIYQLPQVSEIALMVPKEYLPDEEDERDWRLTYEMWVMLERERNGKDPISKDLHPQLVNINSVKNPAPLFGNVQEVIPWAIKLMNKLLDLPTYSSGSRFNIPCKQLEMNSSKEAKVLSYMNSAARDFLGIKNMWIPEVRDNPYPKFTLYIDDSTNPPYDIEDLEMAYQKVIQQITQNWLLSSLEECPGVRATVSIEDYALFINKDRLVSGIWMWSGINLLASVLGISDYLESFYTKNTDDNFTYLWIRKNKLEMVKEILKLDFA